MKNDVIADEAYRSQYGFIDSDARHMRDLFSNFRMRLFRYAKSTQGRKKGDRLGEKKVTGYFVWGRRRKLLGLGSDSSSKV